MNRRTSLKRLVASVSMKFNEEYAERFAGYDRREVSFAFSPRNELRYVSYL